MASVANKLAFFTTLAFGRDLTASSDPLDNPRLAFTDFIRFLNSMNSSIEEMTNDMANMNHMVYTLNGSMSLLESELVTNDYYFTNQSEIKIPKTGRHNVHTFSVPAGETLDLHVNVTTHQAGKNNALWLFLYQDGQ